MKRRIVSALILLAAYPTAVACFSFFEGGEDFEWLTSVMTIRLLTAIASFCGMSMLVGEYQSRKQIKNYKEKFSNSLDHTSRTWSDQGNGLRRK